jgi:hypothetical protein
MTRRRRGDRIEGRTLRRNLRRGLGRLVHLSKMAHHRHHRKHRR